MIHLLPLYQYYIVNLELLYFVSFLIGGILVAYAINKLMLVFYETLGLRSKNDTVERWSATKKPSLGGVSLFIVFVFTAIAYAILYNTENIFGNEEMVGLILGSTMAFGMGLSDDAYNTQPYFKLITQISCGIVLVGSNMSVHLFNNEIIDAVLTVIWVVLLMNSLNMLDNMDGITATTCLFCLLTCLGGYFMFNGFSLDIWTILLISQIGALLGFLILNIHPSKLFMGDAGSQFIGHFVAFFTIKTTLNIGHTYEVSSFYGVIIALVTLTPAGVDTLTVVINRLKAGKSPSVGGKDHTTHHLVYAGLNDRQVWYVFLLIAFVGFALSILAFYLTRGENSVYIFLFPLFFILVFVLLYRLTIIHKDKVN